MLGGVEDDAESKDQYRLALRNFTLWFAERPVKVYELAHQYKDKDELNQNLSVAISAFLFTISV